VWHTHAETKIPRRYQGYPALRAGVLLCEQQCKDGVLDYRFDETLASSTDGPMVRGYILSSNYFNLSSFPVLISPLLLFFFIVGCKVGREQQQV
jgi:hypothetical protein